MLVYNLHHLHVIHQILFLTINELFELPYDAYNIIFNACILNLKSFFKSSSSIYYSFTQYLNIAFIVEYRRLKMLYIYVYITIKLYLKNIKEDMFFRKILGKKFYIEFISHI